MVTLVGLGWASWNVQFSLWMLISRLVKTENLLDVVRISRLRRIIVKFARCQKQNSLLRLVNLKGNISAKRNLVNIKLGKE